MKTKMYLGVWAIVAIVLIASCKRSDNDYYPPTGNEAGADWPMTLLSTKNITINVDDLPSPDTTASATNFPQVLMSRPATAKFSANPGFVVNLYEENLPGARTMCVAPNGDVFVAISTANKVVILRDKDNDGHSDTTFTWDEGGLLNRPYGMSFYQNKLYVANSSAVVKYDYAPGQTKAAGVPLTIATYPGGGQHAYRSLALDTMNGKMYVGIGSTMNVGFEDDPRYATIQRFNINGSGGETFADGIRNPQALAINYTSGNGVLWSAVNERDGLGDELVPDYVTALPTKGSFYGWPYVYLRGDKPDPRIQGTDPRIATTKTPEVLLEAHCAALGILFYTGNQFPDMYRGDAFVAMRGSWNRANASGYKIVRIKMNKSGQAVGGYEDFLKGWHMNEGVPGKPEVFGRPVSLAIAKDGSMLITDDAGGAIWRLRWKGN